MADFHTPAALQVLQLSLITTKDLFHASIMTHSKVAGKAAASDRDLQGLNQQLWLTDGGNSVFTTALSFTRIAAEYG